MCFDQQLLASGVLAPESRGELLHRPAWIAVDLDDLTSLTPGLYGFAPSASWSWFKCQHSMTIRGSI